MAERGEVVGLSCPEIVFGLEGAFFEVDEVAGALWGLGGFEVCHYGGNMFWEATDPMDVLHPADAMD